MWTELLLKSEWESTRAKGERIDLGEIFIFFCFLLFCFSYESRGSALSVTTFVMLIHIKQIWNCPLALRRRALLRKGGRISSARIKNSTVLGVHVFLGEENPRENTFRAIEAVSILRVYYYLGWIVFMKLQAAEQHLCRRPD